MNPGKKCPKCGNTELTISIAEMNHCGSCFLDWIDKPSEVDKLKERVTKLESWIKSVSMPRSG